ncbi:MAG: hypothetical protein IPK53_11000 [bacterium]|nr:hypothetical protein [bacterium]
MPMLGRCEVSPVDQAGDAMVCGRVQHDRAKHGLFGGVAHGIGLTASGMTIPHPPSNLNAIPSLGGLVYVLTMQPGSSRMRSTNCDESV